MPGTETKHKVRDVNVRMLRGGSGPPLLFLHGANGLPVWLPVFDLLSKQFEVFVPEHPGFGTSDNPAVAAQHRRSGDVLPRFPRRVRAASRSMSSASRSAAGPRPRPRCAIARGCKTLSLLGPAGIRIKGMPSGDNFIWGPEEAVRNLYHDQAIPDQILAMQPTDEQADILLTNRFAAAKFGWEPRWYNPSLERWLHRITRADADHVGQGGQAVPERLCGALGRTDPGQPRRDRA